MKLNLDKLKQALEEIWPFGYVLKGLDDKLQQEAIDSLVAVIEQNLKETK